MTGEHSQITIVGLGPGDPESRTIGVQRALDIARRIILRTRIHPGIDDLESDPRVSDCDDLYEIASGFDELYPAIADRVLDAARRYGHVVFAVPGHPRFGERVIPFIEDRGRLLEITVTVLDAVSFVDASVAALKVDPVIEGLQVADAEYLAATLDQNPFAAGLRGIDPARPLLVAQVYNETLSAAVKIALSRIYPEDHAVTLVHAAGFSHEEIAPCVPLHLLDRQTIDHLTSLWVPPLPVLDAVRVAETLVGVVARLRSPAGCPWDRAQTHASLRNAVLEEAYEVVDAIDLNDDDGLAEELGDLLLLITMHAQLAEEEDLFRIEDIYEGITRKLIRRHPHVFGDVVAATPSAVIATWEGVKENERKARGNSESDVNPVDRLPRPMPATRKAIEVLAPRAVLRAPDDTAAGDKVLAAVRALIDEGIDPERALESSLREFVAARSNGRTPRKERSPFAMVEKGSA